jgi:hypothetical protein
MPVGFVNRSVGLQYTCNSALCAATIELLRTRLRTDVPDLLSPQLLEACQSLPEARMVIAVLQSRWQTDRYVTKHGSVVR